jgi:hypothetical protein
VSSLLREVGVVRCAIVRRGIVTTNALAALTRTNGPLDDLSPEVKYCTEKE